MDSTGQSKSNRGQLAGGIAMVLCYVYPRQIYSRALRDSLARPRVALLGVRGGLVPLGSTSNGCNK